MRKEVLKIRFSENVIWGTPEAQLASVRAVMVLAGEASLQRNGLQSDAVLDEALAELISSGESCTQRLREAARLPRLWRGR